MSPTTQPSFTQLRLWHEAHRFALKVATVADDLPIDERFCLASQMRRASLSVPCNLVEGHALWGTPSYLRHVRIARASMAETQYQIMFARDRNYLDVDRAEELLNDAGSIHRQLLALIQTLQGQLARNR